MSKNKKSELRPAFIYLGKIGKSNCKIARFFSVDKNTVNNAINRIVNKLFEASECLYTKLAENTSNKLLCFC